MEALRYRALSLYFGGSLYIPSMTYGQCFSHWMVSFVTKYIDSGYLGNPFASNNGTCLRLKNHMANIYKRCLVVWTRIFYNIAISLLVAWELKWRDKYLYWALVQSSLSYTIKYSVLLAEQSSLYTIDEHAKIFLHHAPSVISHTTFIATNVASGIIAYVMIVYYGTI